MTTPKTLTVRLERCTDVPGAWAAHLLDVDLITQGDSPEHALEMLADAIRVCQEDDEQRGLRFWDRKPDPTYGRPVMLCTLEPPEEPEVLEPRRDTQTIREEIRQWTKAGDATAPRPQK